MKEELKGWLDAAMDAAIIIMILFFVLFPFKVSGESMEKTLNDGDRVFVSRVMATMGMYNKGDLIMFECHIDNKNIKMVKRVIATEGDKVTIEDGKLYINGILQDEEYVFGETDGAMDFVVGKGEIFVLGDNRPNSIDSRHFGQVNKKDVKGRVVIKLFPFGDFAVFGWI